MSIRARQANARSNPAASILPAVLRSSLFLALRCIPLMLVLAAGEMLKLRAQVATADVVGMAADATAILESHLDLLLLHLLIWKLWVSRQRLRQGCFQLLKLREDVGALAGHWGVPLLRQAPSAAQPFTNRINVVVVAWRCASCAPTHCRLLRRCKEDACTIRSRLPQPDVPRCWFVDADTIAEGCGACYGAFPYLRGSGWRLLRLWLRGVRDCASRPEAHSLARDAQRARF